MAAFTAVLETPSPEIHMPEEWLDAANSITYYVTTSSPPIALICGAKNSGKTTFSRHLLNTLLLSYRKVAYLDTDVGQPEFTPPGCLSLTIIDQTTLDFSIPCLKTPDRCYFFGDVSSKRDPEGYLNYVFELYDHYKREYCSSRKNESSRNVPLIVNTPGWVKGIGFDVLVGMLKHIAPTHVVKINISPEVFYLKRKKINPEDKNLPAGLFWLDVHDDAPVNLLEITSASKDSQGRPAIDISKNLLYVITPVPLDILSKVDSIQQGFIQIPTSLLQVQGCISPYMSSNVLPEESSQKMQKKGKISVPDI